MRRNAVGASETGHGSAVSGQSENVALTPQVGGGLIGEAVFLGSAERGHAIGEKPGQLAEGEMLVWKDVDALGVGDRFPSGRRSFFHMAALRLAVRENGSPR